MFLKIIKSVVLVVITLCISNGSYAADTLDVNYLEKFPSNINFDAKYENVNDYLVYKYIELSYAGTLDVASTDLSFAVDRDWYQENQVKDVIFLKYDNGQWIRVAYNDKNSDNSYVNYNFTSDTIGEYWAIIGIIPTDRSAAGELELTEFQEGIGQDLLKAFKEGEVLEAVTKISKEVIGTLKEPEVVKGVSTIATTTATLSAATVVIFVGGPGNLLVLLQQVGLAIFGAVSLRKKQRAGIVYDVSTGVPVSLARVDLIDSHSKRIKKSKFTNKKGRYFFLAPEGKYFLSVKKKGYRIIESEKGNLAKALLHKETLGVNVKIDEAGVIKKDIAILNKSKDVKFEKTRTIIRSIIKRISRIVFVVGVLASAWICYISPSTLNFGILAVYVIIIIFTLAFMKKEEYGKIVNEDGKAVALATVTIKDIKTDKLITRVISNMKGQYYILLEKGGYYLEIRTVEGINVKKRINVKNKSVLSQKIVIKK